MASHFLSSADGYVPLRFDNMAYVLTSKKNVLVTSGVIVPSPKLDTIIGNGGNTFELPFWDDIDPFDSANNDRTSNETALPNLFAGGSNYPLPQALHFNKQIGVRVCRNQSWGNFDLADTLLLDGDPMTFIAGRFSTYQSWRLQALFLAECVGIFADNDAAPSGTEHVQGDLTLDISNAAGSGVFSPGVTTFGAAAHIKATQLLGDNKGDLAVILMNSVVEAGIALQDLIETIRDSEGKIQFKTFMGMRIVVDDDMTSPSTGVYDTYYFGLGSFILGHSMPKVPLEYERYAGAGNGAGAGVLYHRWEWCLHPVGHKWTVASTGGGPLNTGGAGNLDDVNSWQRVFRERKQIKIARVRSREA